MSLIHRQRSEVDWPDLFGARMFDVPAPWKDLFGDSDMKVEEFREGDTLVVRAEMPGIDPDKDVEITVADGMLHLSAERRSETTTEDKKGYRSEFRYGSFARSVRLPAGAGEDDVKATYDNGILEVRIPIDEGSNGARKIPITRGSS
jgi:HSP20 family protein